MMLLYVYKVVGYGYCSDCRRVHEKVEALDVVVLDLGTAPLQEAPNDIAPTRPESGKKSSLFGRLNIFAILDALSSVSWAYGYQPPTTTPWMFNNEPPVSDGWLESQELISNFRPTPYDDSTMDRPAS